MKIVNQPSLIDINQRISIKWRLNHSTVLCQLSICLYRRVISKGLMRLGHRLMCCTYSWSLLLQKIEYSFITCGDLFEGPQKLYIRVRLQCNNARYGETIGIHSLVQPHGWLSKSILVAKYVYNSLYFESLNFPPGS